MVVESLLWLYRAYCGCTEPTVVVQSLLWLCRAYCGGTGCTEPAVVVQSNSPILDRQALLLQIS